MADTRAAEYGDSFHPTIIRSAHGAEPHSLRFLPDGLQNGGACTLLTEIDYQLGRTRT